MPLDKRFVYENVEIIHRVSPRNRHSYIRIDGEGRVLLTSPRISEAEAHRIIGERMAWILKKLELQSEKIRPEPRLGEEIYYMGAMHPLGENPAFDDLEAALGRLRKRSEAAMLRCYERFYRERAADHLAERLAHFEPLCGCNASALSVRKMRSRWGSCTARGLVTFNSRVMQLPETLIDYIVVHELTHLHHMNHSRAFYAALARVLPDHRRREAAIKNYGLL